MAHSIFCFVPAFGQMVTTHTFLSTHKLFPMLAQRGIGGGISSLSYPDLPNLRNMALTIWYDTLPHTHFLQIDADMGFEPELIFDQVMFDEPVVGAICPKRILPIEWAGSGTGQKVAETRGGFMKVAGTGMAITLIRRDAIKTMLEQIEDLSDPQIEYHPAYETILKPHGLKRLIRAFDRIRDPEKGELSEDLSFCRRWTQCGGSVWAAINHRIAHVGPYAYGAEISYAEYAAQRGAAEEAKRLQAAE